MNVLPSLPPVPEIRTRRDLDALLENIAQLHRVRDDLRREQENEIAGVRQRYRASFAELENFLALETGWAEAWARAHRHDFTADGTLVGAQTTIGFRAEPPRVERASRRWTWSRIAATLGELDWGRRYLRTPAPEVDQAALTADLGKLSHDDLRAAGMIVVQGDSFYITPPIRESETATAMIEPDWQKAA
jgi:phage host-nuclease inhibitor protein Gam